MPKISRARRAELQHRAAQIRQQGQRAGWDVAAIAEDIARQLPEVKPLEVGLSLTKLLSAANDEFSAGGGG